ncbi:DUF6412 domain-containing protein [Streptomyces sp. LP05-1]|uniref:DUF6412 domain-containing protein n=1 Tax=Streptomyces pyxinae TaxID=2970734 RepID=A0ABT2CBD5_9ACTN|nr:DUF6412 domain-containing protein [Streptomyces sp. LP05-1]MCS0634635.1 DUF6412 domain-containing protein [Streptomyces sp. LP05-1]
MVKLLRSTGPVLLLLAGLLLIDGSPLSTAFALAATAAAGAALVACALVSARTIPVVPPQRVRTAIRDREQRTAFLPQRDPDASGRRRPRAPGRPLPTAA